MGEEQKRGCGGGVVLANPVRISGRGGGMGEWLPGGRRGGGGKERGCTHPGGLCRRGGHRVTGMRVYK